MAVPGDGACQQRQHAGLHQALPVLLVLQAGVAHAADPGAGHVGRVSIAGQRGHEQLQALGVQEVGLAISQGRQGIEGLEEEPLVTRCGQLPGLQEDGVGPLLGCQKAAGLLLLALLAKAGKLCRRLLRVRAGHRFPQVIQGLGDMGEMSGSAQSEEGHSDSAGPPWDPSAWDLGLGGSPVGPVPAGAASTPVLLGALTGLERPQRERETETEALLSQCP